MATPDRGMWGSRIGFILAAAGSAVGLGNIWGFPTQVGLGGGAVFVIVYLLCVFFICAPIFISTIAAGIHVCWMGVGSQHLPMPAILLRAVSWKLRNWRLSTRRMEPTRRMSCPLLRLVRLYLSIWTMLLTMKYGWNRRQAIRRGT